MKGIHTVQGRLQRFERLRKDSAHWPKIETALKDVFAQEGSFWGRRGNLKDAVLKAFAGSREIAPFKMHNNAWILTEFADDVAKRKSVDVDGRPLPTRAAFFHRLGLKL